MPVDASPAALRDGATAFLLEPEYGIVPFDGRDQELAELERWCAGEGRLLVRLLCGAGFEVIPLNDKNVPAVCWVKEGWASTRTVAPGQVRRWIAGMDMIPGRRANGWALLMKGELVDVEYDVEGAHEDGFPRERVARGGGGGRAGPLHRVALGLAPLPRAR